jgi:DNA-binding beta-propeller fold protein YncE
MMRSVAGLVAGILLMLGLSACQAAPAAGPSPKTSAGAAANVVARIKVGERAGAPAVGESAVWVPNTGDGTLSRIDPQRNRVAATITIGVPEAMLAHGCGPTNEHTFYSGSFLFRRCDIPSAVATSPGWVWVTKNDDQSVARINPRTNRITQVIPIGTDSWGIAADLYQVWVTDYYHGKVVRIDPASNRAVTTLTGFNGPTGVAIGAGAVWVVETDARRLVRIDPATNLVTSHIPIGDDAAGVVVGLGSVWVENEWRGTVTRVDPATQSVVATIEVGPREGRNGLAGMCVHQDRIWQGGIQLQAIDPATNQVSARLPQEGIAAASGFGSLWATSIRGDIERINLG